MSQPLAVLAVAAVAACSSPAPTVPIGEVQQGVATFYDATGRGNCSFDATSDPNIAAMNAVDYQHASACGACVEVTGPKGKVTVRIVDQCADCGKGHVDLSRAAFANLADPSLGRIDVTWRYVSCSVSGPLAYHYKDSSSQFWTAIQVRNHRLPIKSLELLTDRGAVTLPRQDYNYFIAEQGAGAGSVKVRVTASDGQQVEDTLPPVQSDVTVQGAAQFK